MLVGGVDDGVDVELGDVPFEQLEQGLVHLEGYSIVGPRDRLVPHKAPFYRIQGSVSAFREVR